MSDVPARVLVVDDSATIRRVVGSVLQRAGHEVVTCASGDAALVELPAFQPDILLVDFTMPTMNGLDLVRRLGDELGDDLPPIVLMCTRSDPVPAVDGALRAAGVVDTITKPFSPEALLAVLHHCIGKHRRPSRVSEATRVVTSLASIAAADVADNSDDDVRGSDFSRDFSDDERTAPSSKPATATQASTQVASTTQGQAAGIALPPNVALAGDLSVIALPEILQLLKFQAQTGLLLVDAGGLRFQVALDNGAVVALSAQEADGAPTRRTDLLLGHYFVALGFLDEAQLEAVLAAPALGRPIGERLVGAGLVTADDLRRAIGEQVQDLMVELLRARRGVFALQPGAWLLPAVVVRPGWSVDALLFEALRRIDEWHVIESEVPSFEARFALRGAVDESGLSAEEAAILRTLQHGPLRVKDIARRSPLRHFDVCRVLYRLAVLKRVRRIDDGDQSRLVSEDGAPQVPLLSTPPQKAGS